MKVSLKHLRRLRDEAYLERELADSVAWQGGDPNKSYYYSPSCRFDQAYREMEMAWSGGE